MQCARPFKGNEDFLREKSDGDGTRRRPSIAALSQEERKDGKGGDLVVVVDVVVVVFLAI